MHEIYEDTCHGDYKIIEGTYYNVHTIQNAFKQHENLQDATNKEHDKKIVWGKLLQLGNFFFKVVIFRDFTAVLKIK
jgi:hypothetical protein